MRRRDIFELNGLTDITYDEAIRIYEVGYPKSQAPLDSYYSVIRELRTNLPPKSSLTNWGCPYFSTKVHVINLGYCQQDNFGIYACRFLYKVMGTIRITTTVGGVYTINGGVASLVDIHVFTKTALPVVIEETPVLSLDSVQFFVKNSAAGSSLRLHKNVYAKLTGDTTNAAAAELSEEELKQWTDLADLAAERGIGLLTA